MDVAVFTANIGQHDYVHDVAPQTVDADWWYVAPDEETGIAVPLPWTWLKVEPKHRDPRLEAKLYRMPPFGEVVPFSADHYDFVIWIDASTEVTSTHFLADVLAAADNGCPLTTWAHPFRNDVGDEAQASLVESREKYEPCRGAIASQLVDYAREQLPYPSGLYATGTLVWNMRHPLAMMLGAAWMAEIERTSIHDQLSLPAVAYRLGACISTFPFSQIEFPRRVGNRWLRYHDHTRRT